MDQFPYLYPLNVITESNPVLAESLKISIGRINPFICHCEECMNFYTQRNLLRLTYPINRQIHHHLIFPQKLDFEFGRCRQDVFSSSFHNQPSVLIEALYMDPFWFSADLPIACLSHSPVLHFNCSQHGNHSLITRGYFQGSVQYSFGLFLLISNKVFFCGEKVQSQVVWKHMQV